SLVTLPCVLLVLFLVNDAATSEIYTLSLHDALPIWVRGLEVAPQATTDFYYLMLNANAPGGLFDDPRVRTALNAAIDRGQISERSEEHTSELQSRENLVCRLLLEKKKNRTPITRTTT